MYAFTIYVRLLHLIPHDNLKLILTPLSYKVSATSALTYLLAKGLRSVRTDWEGTQRAFGSLCTLLKIDKYFLINQIRNGFHKRSTL